MAKPTMKSLAGCIFFVKKLHGTLCHEVFGRLLVPNALKVACLDATIWPIEFLKTSLATAKFEHFFDFRLLVFSLRWPSREANWVKNPYLSQVSLETPIFGGFYKDDTTQDVFLWISPSSSFFRQKFAKPLPCWALLWKKPLVLGQKEMTYWAMFGLRPVRLRFLSGLSSFNAPENSICICQFVDPHITEIAQNTFPSASRSWWAKRTHQRQNVAKFRNKKTCFTLWPWNHDWSCCFELSWGKPWESSASEGCLFVVKGEHSCVYWTATVADT